MEGHFNIVGWSPYRRTGGVTGHVLAMGEVASRYFGLNVDLRADHFGPRPLESYVGAFGKDNRPAFGEDFYSGPDYPNYLKCLMQWEKAVRKRSLGHIGELDLGDRCRLLKPVENSNANVFEGGKGDICLVDSSGMNSPYSFKVLNEADMILVFLPNSDLGIQRFFDYYSALLKKSFFIINRYSESDAIPLKILEGYRVLPSRIGTIPYCKSYDRACREGAIDTFIEQNLHRRSPDIYYRCIKNLTKKVLIEVQKQKS